MTHPRNAPPNGASAAGADAEKAAFLRDLRALRDQAGLGPRELAARAHFPEDTLTTAEAGPALPTLPVLQAYVRACGAGEADWEDRWRRLNQDGTSGGNELPTRAPSANRPPARIMPFPEPEAGPNPAEQDAIGFGLARVARGLAPIEPDPAPAPFTQPHLGAGMPAAAANAPGWFDPAPRPSSSPSMFTPSPASPPAAPPAPEVSPGPPTVQYPALSGYGTPEGSYPGYTPPSYQPPEAFRTPVPAPPSPPPPAPRGPSATMVGLGRTAPAPPAAPAGSSAPSATPGTSGTPATPGAPNAHAAPAAPRRHTAAWTAGAVIAVLIIAIVVWLVLHH
jgi:hypothetical protein